MSTLDSVFTDEQISDLYLTYIREKKLGGNIHAALVKAITPLISQIDQITGTQNDAEQWATIIEEEFAHLVK